MISREHIAAIERAQRGDTAAFSTLVVAYQDLVLGTAFGWFGALEPARDAAQEALIDAYLHIAQLKEASAFPAWLRRIVVKHCDRATRASRPPERSIESAASVPEPGPSPDQYADEQERTGRVRLAVEALPESERLVVSLHYFADVSGNEIASFLELPLSTVKKRLRSARAHLREEGERLMQETIGVLRPSRDTVFAEEVQFFIALRTGDRERVRALLAQSPQLANAQANWDSSVVEQGVLPFANRATALIAMIARNDLAMSELLLDAGAGSDGTCSCETGESPVWAAVAHNRMAHLRMLLQRGANPDVVAATGNSPLHVAAMRGNRDMVETLLQHGANANVRDAGGRTPADWAQANHHAAVLALLHVAAPNAIRTDATKLNARGVSRLNEAVVHTGIRALDFFAPLPLGGLVRVPFRAGLGMVVLLGELSARFTANPHCAALWIGFTHRAVDPQDWQAEFAEMGIGDRVHHGLSSANDSPTARRDAFLLGLEQADRLSDEGDDVLVVLLTDRGFESDVEASLPRLATARSRGQLTTLVVTPFSSQVQRVSPPLRAPYKTQIMFDRHRAARWLFPAIDPIASTSTLLASEIVGARQVQLIQRSQRLLRWYKNLDPTLSGHASDQSNDDREDAIRAKAMLKFFAQRFFIAEPFSGAQGERTDRAALLDGVEAILDSCATERSRGSAGVAEQFLRTIGDVTLSVALNPQVNGFPGQ